LKTVSSASKSLHFPSLVLTGAIALALAAPAHAGKRDPAPIVYATGTSPYPEGKPQYIEPSRAPDAKQKKQARIQFRYPGSADAAESAGVTAGQGIQHPEPAAREYASIEAATPNYSAVSGTRPNSFDARAAAARIEAQRSVSAVESEPLESLQPVTPPPPAPAVSQSSYQPSVRTLTPASAYAVSSEPVPVFDETSVAIVYGAEFNGLPTANGETFDPSAMTAAHPTLPLPSLIQVVNTETGQEVVLRVNDRGPFEDGASLQVSPRAANELGMNGAGKAKLRVRYLGAAPAVASPSSPEPAPQMASSTPYEAADYVAPVAYEPAPVAPQPREENANLCLQYSRTSRRCGRLFRPDRVFHRYFECADPQQSRSGISASDDRAGTCERCRLLPCSRWSAAQPV
jgi:rare lipoprotein A